MSTVTLDAPVFRDRLLESLRDEPGRTWLTLVQDGGEATFTCQALQGRIADYAAFYRDRGIRRGDVVLVVLRESLDLFASFLAGIIAGALPAYFAYPSPKQTTEAFLLSIQNLIAVNDVPLVITYPEIADLLQANRAGLGRRLGAVHDTSVVSRRGSLEPLSLDGDGPEAFLQFSSGTTGAKKGVRISSRALFNQVDAYDEYVQYDSQSRVVSWLPHYHDMGLIACMLMPLLKRIPITMLSPFDWVRSPGLLFGAVTRQRGTHVWLPNFALGHLTRSVPDSALAQYDLGSLRQVVCCSEPVLHDTVRAFVDRFKSCGLRDEAIRNCYAMAENTFAIASTAAGPVKFLEIDAERFAKDEVAAPLAGGKPVACVGSPLRNVELRIVDAAMSPLVENGIGEVVLRSHSMLDEYHNNPTATGEAIVDGWFRTGDLGFLHAGQLYITGRKKDLIIVGGENIYPQDIELILDAEPGLVPGRSVVFGVDDDRAGTERIVALAEVDGGNSTPDNVRLRTKIFERIGASVAEIMLLAPGTLRKSTAGKISRGINRHEYLAGAFDAPRAELSPDLITRIVVDILPGHDTPTISSDTPLLSSGLVDSLTFTELVLALEAAFHISIPPTWQDRARFDSIRRIAATIAALRRGTAANAEDADEVRGSRAASLAALRAGPPRRHARPEGKIGLVELLINKCPVPSSRVYRFLFRQAGIKIGRNVTFAGRVRVRLGGDPSRISIGNDVVIGDNVEIRNRERGRIVLEDRVNLDDDVRLVAARDGSLEIGHGATLGRGTIVNSGGTTRIGRYAMISSYVSINASTHDTDRGSYIASQPFRHGTVEIGADVWIGSGAVVVLNCWLGEGAVVGSNAMVTGRIPAFAVCSGVPAKVERYR